jgi:putative endonuclease
VERPYFIYLLRCADNSLYTGITTDIRRRFAEHSGKPVGAKYTAARTPVRMERAWCCDGRSAASKLEARIKQLTHAQKELLVSDATQLAPLLAHVVDTTLYREETI